LGEAATGKEGAMDIRKHFHYSTFGLILAAGLVLFSPVGTSAAESYKVDPGHSSLIFRVKHFDAGYVYGRFNDFSGSFHVDTAKPHKSKVEITVKAASVDTGNVKRDQHLRSPDFLASKQFPLITFRSEGAKKVDANTAEVKGKLTLHGVTRDLSVRVERVGAGKDPRGNQLLGVQTTFSFKRSDFGIKFMPGGISDEIVVTLAVEGILDKDAKHARAD
jgi:polyisoprenoid-binding protein YceI